MATPAKAVCEAHKDAGSGNETIQFINRLKILAVDRNVFVDLAHVRVLTPEAIACLIAVIHRFEGIDAGISGNVPTDAGIRAMMDHSGFRDYVRSSPGWNPTSALMGRVRKRSRSRNTVQNRYDQNISRELISFAMEKLTGKPRSHGPSYGTMGEAMLNTLNHASPDSSLQPWWASVYVDEGRKCACFTFIDQGVGIFQSHRLTAALKLGTGLTLLSRADILGKILNGEVRSTTRIPGRGNGLPGMYTHCKKGRIRNFVVVANDAIGYAETDQYRAMKVPFHGTLLYWEIRV
jgi:hypothetical protein